MPSLSHSGPHNRAENAASAKRFANTLTYATLGSFVWALIYPHPYPVVIAILVCLPLIAIAAIARWKNVYNIEKRASGSRPNLAFPLILPSLILALRTLHDVYLLHWQSLLPPAAIVTAFIAPLLSRANWSKRKAVVPILTLYSLLFFFPYTCAALAQANIILDGSTPERYHTSVLGKRISAGGRRTTLYLQLGPWGPRRDSNEVAVSRSLYTAFAPGEPICIDLRSGALRFPWYKLSACH